MNDGYHGFAYNSRDGQQQAVPEDDRAIKASYDEERCQPKAVSGSDECKEELEEIKQGFLNLPPSEQEEVIGALVVRMESELEWSGLLPDPESFGKYPENVQEKMVAWNDAQILDELKRNDELVRAFIGDKRRSQFGNFAINACFLLASFISFIVTRDPASFGFLSVPGFTIAVNVIQSRRDSDK